MAIARIKVDKKVMRGLITAMKKLPSATKRMLGATVGDVARVAEYEAVRHCPINDGRLRTSLTVDQPDYKMAFMGTNVSYAPFVEYGTGPHKTSIGSAQFVESIKEWCLKKGIAAPYAVIQSIRRNGTKAQPFLEPAFAKADKEASGILNKNAKSLFAQISAAARSSKK